MHLRAIYVADLIKAESSFVHVLGVNVAYWFRLGVRGTDSGASSENGRKTGKGVVVGEVCIGAFAQILADVRGVPSKKVLPAFVPARGPHLTGGSDIRRDSKPERMVELMQIKEAGELLIIEGLHRLSIVYELTQTFCPNLILYYAFTNLIVFVMAQV